MDIILYNILAGFICVIIGYLFGSIPFSIIIGKVFFKKDPRDYGSKNAGGTNCMRVFGKGWKNPSSPQQFAQFGAERCAKHCGRAQKRSLFFQGRFEASYPSQCDTH